MEGNKIVHLVGVSWTTVALQLDRARVNQSLGDWVGGMQTTLTLERASLGQGVNWMLLGHSDELVPEKLVKKGDGHLPDGGNYRKPLTVLHQLWPHTFLVCLLIILIRHPTDGVWLYLSPAVWKSS